MINVSKLELVDNLLLIEEHPVEVAVVTSTGVHLSEQDIAAKRAAQRFRTGIVLSHGKITYPGADANQVGKIVMYPAERVDGLDLPICKDEEPNVRLQRVVMLDLNTIFSYIKE